MIQERNIRASTDEPLALAAQACRKALAADGAVALAASLGADAPATPEAWFDLLSPYPDKYSYDIMMRLKGAAAAAGHGDGARVEQYAVLQAMSVAAPRMMTLPLPGAVKRQFAQLCERVAAPVPAVRRQLDIARQPFAEIAMLATLRRYPAGEVVFDTVHMPKSWLLKIHPLNLPGFAAELLFGTGGMGPFAAPHVNAWRQNPLIMQKEEHQRALWRIAKTLELNPRMRGLMTDAWLLSLAAGQSFPHLAWMRALYIETGAYIVDMEPAPDDSGFMVGSARRRQLYGEGQFFPRRTLALVRRDEMLAWAAAHPELADDGETPVRAPVRRSRWKVTKTRPSPLAARHNSPLMLWNGSNLLNKQPKKYILSVLLLPALLAAVAAAAALPGLLAGAAALMVTFAVMWVLQYFCFQ